MIVSELPEFIQGRESFIDSSTKREIKDLAEKFAKKFDGMGFSTTVEHSGSKAGASSYVKVYDPQTGRFLTKLIRISDHSKGAKESAAVIDILNPRKDFEKIVLVLQDMRKMGDSLVIKQDRYAQQLIDDGFKPKAAYKKAKLEMFDQRENPIMATKRSFSPAQLAAQKLFAERARAGTLKKGKRKTTRKANPGLYENINAKKKRIAAGSGEKMRKPGEPGRPTAKAFERSAMTAKRNPITETLIYGLAPGETRDYMEELMYAGGQKLTQAQIEKVFKAAGDAGYHSFRVAGFDPTVKPDFAAAVRRKRNPDKAKPRAYVRRASQATGAPPSKRLVTRRKKALTAPAGYFPNPKTAPMVVGYQVICMHPKKHVVGVFKTMPQAKEMARALADYGGVPYAIKKVKIHKTHFMVHDLAIM